MTLLARSVIDRDHLRQGASDQIDLFKQPESMLRLNKLSRIPVFARSQEEKDELETLKSKICYNVCDQNECDFTLVTLGRKIICANLWTVKNSGLFNMDIPAVDILVRSVDHQEVVYPLDEEDSQRLLDQLGPIESWGDHGTL